MLIFSLEHQMLPQMIYYFKVSDYEILQVIKNLKINFGKIVL